MSRIVQLDQVERRHQVALDLILRLRDRSEADVAERMGVSRQAVGQRRRGETRIRGGDVLRLAEALEVPPAVFSMEPAELLRWFAEQPVELVSAQETMRIFRWSCAPAAA